jgi:hypothetical protein
MTIASGRQVRRECALAELGLVRWSLRDPAGVSASAPETTIAVCTAAGESLPTAGPAAAIWVQVLAWLNRAPMQVEWTSDRGLVLPPLTSWRDAEGKRGLWLALKHLRARG